MTLLDWFSQNPWMQLFLIWCASSYIFSWFGVGYVLFFKKLIPGKRPSKSKILILLIFAPIIIPYILWID